MLVAAILCTVTVVAREADNTERAGADALPTNLVAAATVTIGSVSDEALRSIYVDYLTDGRTSPTYAALTAGADAPGANFVDVDLGSVAGPETTPWRLIRVFTGGAAGASNGGAWVFYDDVPFTSSDPAVLVAAGVPHDRIADPAPQRSTFVTPGQYRYVRIISRDANRALALSEIEVLDNLAPHLRSPDGVPNSSVNLAATASATQWPGLRDAAAGPFGAIDGDLNTRAATSDDAQNGSFVQVDLRTTIEVASIELVRYSGSTGCNWNHRLLTTDDAGFVGQTVAETDVSAGRSGLYTSTGLGPSGSRTITVEGPVRYIRLQRLGCGHIGAREIIVRPSSRAVLVEPIPDQIVNAGAPVSLPVRLLADTDAAVLVDGLPRGFAYDGLNIVGSGEIQGRWPVEITALAPDGRTSTMRFVFTVIAGPPEGDVQQPPAVDVTRLPSRPSEVGYGVMGDTRGRNISGGNVNDTTTSLDITVWDMVELGPHMYVGGEFSRVVDDVGNANDQAFLARFRVDTGAWDDSWRPQLDGNVHALEISPRGRLLVGGEFTSVNGLPKTAGLAAINPNTGEVDTQFEAFVERAWNPNAPAVVRDLAVAGRWLYVAGKFSHINGSGGNRERAFSVARVSANWGTIDSIWKPNVTGRSIWGVAPNHAQNRVYLAGYFGAIEGKTGTNSGGTVDAVTGAFVENNYFPKNDGGRPETYDVDSFGTAFVVAGSQHFLSVSDVDNSARGSRPRSWSYASNATTGWRWPGPQRVGGRGIGGDMQFVTRIGDYMITGCHCQDDVDGNGRGIFYNSITGRSTRHKVAMALHATGEQAFTPVESFKPDIEGGIDGAWTATTDSRGCLWIGGDITTAGLRTGGRVFARGFARFCTPPGAVNGLNVIDAELDRVTLSWNPPEPDDTFVGYVVRRDGQYLGFVGPDGPYEFTDTTVEPAHEYTYTVSQQAGDGTEDNGATVTATAGADDGEPPSIPSDVAAAADGIDVVVSWTASQDAVGVSGYQVFRDGTYLGFTEDTFFVDGSALELGGRYTVRALDLVDNRSEPSEPVYVPEKDPALDDVAPSIPQWVGISGRPGDVTLEWLPSTDNLAMQGYLIYRNGDYAGFSATTTFVDDAAAYGDTWTVRAQDVNDNRSKRSVPIELVDPAGPDIEPPTTPEGLAADLDGTVVTLTWEASTDDRAMNGYLVYRNGAYLGFTREPSFVDTAGERGIAYSVRAVDAAENRSERTDPVPAGAPDIAAPSVPADLAVELVADGAALTWAASTDDIGVQGYLVYRDGAYIDFVETPTFLDADGGRGATYAVRSVDTAQNRSERSEAVLAGDPDILPPDLPVGLSAAVNGDVVALSWSAAADDIAVTAYLVYRDGAYIGWSPTPEYADEAVPAGDHSYTVRAVDAAQNRSEGSEPATITVG